MNAQLGSIKTAESLRELHKLRSEAGSGGDEARSAISTRAEQSKAAAVAARPTAAASTAALGPAPNATSGEDKVRTRMAADVMVNACTDYDVLLNEVGPALGDMAGTSPGLYDELAAKLKARYTALSAGGKLVAADIKASMGYKPTPASAPGSSSAGTMVTNFELANRVISSENGNLRVVVEAERTHWIRWDGIRWLRMSKATVSGLVMNMMCNVSTALTSDLLIEPKTRMAIAASLGSDAFKNGTVGALTSSQALHLDPKVLDTHPEYLTVANGAVHIGTGDLVQDRELLLTIKNDVVYDPDAKCPVFLKALEDSFPEGTMEREFYELAFGYTMQGSPSEKMVFFHTGTGDNGKSLFLTAIRTAMGAHAVPVNAALLFGSGHETSSGSAEAASPALFDLKNRRMGFVDEITAGHVVRDGLFKQLSGGLGSLKARMLKEGLEEFDLTSVVHINCNVFAAVRGGQTAVLNRYCPIVYSRTFDISEQDITLADKVKFETAGIFAWLIRCSQKYLEFKAKGKPLKSAMPQSSLDALYDLKKEQNPFSEWLASNCTRSRYAFMATREAVLDYNKFVRELNPDSKAVYSSEKKFAARMGTEKVGEYKEQVRTNERGDKRMNGFIGWHLNAASQFLKGRTANLDVDPVPVAAAFEPVGQTTAKML